MPNLALLTDFRPYDNIFNALKVNDKTAKQAPNTIIFSWQVSLERILPARLWRGKRKEQLRIGFLFFLSQKGRRNFDNTNVTKTISVSIRKG